MVYRGRDAFEDADWHTLRAYKSDSISYGNMIYNLSTDEDTGMTHLEISPNPAYDEVRIEHSGNFKFGYYVFYNSQGLEVLRVPMKSNLDRMDISSLKSGIYTVILSDGVRVRGSSKIMRR